MSYAILRTDKASDQLYAIIQYIAESSGSIDVALGSLDIFEREISMLATSPLMGSYPRYSILRKQGYRVLIVERHLVFYKVNEEAQQVIVYAVVDARQHYLNLI